jgi:protein phosphatase
MFIKSSKPVDPKPPEEFLRTTEEAEFCVNISSSARRGSSAATTNVHAEVAGVSHPGKLRERNDDHFLVSRVSHKQEILLTNLPPDQIPEQTSDEGYSYIVADGMGGMAAGEFASRLAITMYWKLLQESMKGALKGNQRLRITEREARACLDQIRRSLEKIDRTLTEEGRSDERLFGMGTTITAAFSRDHHLFIVHLGDSRAYLYRRGQLEQLTRDHTVAQALADAGQIKQEDVRKHAKRNTLINYLGGHHGNVKPDLSWLRMEDGDCLVLCSDGLSDVVDDTSISQILTQQDTASAAAQALLDEALSRGGKDDVTVVVAGYGIPTVESVDRQGVPEQMPTLGSSFEPRDPTPRCHWPGEISAVSHQGTVPPRNEDYYCVSRFSKAEEILSTSLARDHIPEQTIDVSYLYVVADGMGGPAIRKFLELLPRSDRWGFNINRCFKIDQHAARELCKRISESIHKIEWTMDTTITLAISVGIELFIIHVGKSRAYLFCKGQLRRLTRDHAEGQAIANADHIADENVPQNGLTISLGNQQGQIKVDSCWVRVADGDRMLLCSDGLTNMVDDASIARIIGQQDTATSAAQALLDEALDRGSKDNVTVIVAGYEIPTLESVERARIPEQGPVLDSTQEVGTILRAYDSANNSSVAASDEAAGQLRGEEK